MMSAARPGSGKNCLFRYYTPAWEIGTGLRVALPPGEYEITSEETRDGVRYVSLEETYRICASDVGD